MTSDKGPFKGAAAEVLRWPTARSKEWVCRFLLSASNDANITSVIAIGSAVRPSVSSADLDLAVVCNHAELLKLSPPLEIDLRVYRAEKIQAQIEKGHDVLGWAVKFGRALYQRDRYWDTVVNLWCDRLPLPSAGVSRERAAAAYRRLATVFDFGDADAVHEQTASYLTHLARAELLQRGIYLASRPELASQLRATGILQLADWLDRILGSDSGETALVRRLLQVSA